MSSRSFPVTSCPLSIAGSFAHEEISLYGGGHDASSEADSTCSLRIICIIKISGWTKAQPYGAPPDREPDLQDLQELQRFLMVQEGGLIANQTETGQFAANLHFVNVQECK